jgi:hypothetical protein
VRIAGLLYNLQGVEGIADRLDQLRAGSLQAGLSPCVPCASARGKDRQGRDARRASTTAL